MLGLVIEMAKVYYLEIVNLTKILEGKAGYVLGAAFLCIHQCKKEVIDKLGMYCGTEVVHFMVFTFFV